jgi:hypothetical protein
MVEKSSFKGHELDDLITSFGFFCDRTHHLTEEKYPIANSEYFTSMEQLWLAFVMRKRYKKVWSEEKQESVLEI